MNKDKQLSINLISLFITSALNFGIAFFLTPYVIEYIGKDVYGFVSLANNFTSYVSVATVALNGMLSRFVTIAVSKKDYRSASTYLSSVVIANCVIMLALLAPSALFVLHLERFVNLAAGYESDIKFLFWLIFLGFLINLPGGNFSSATYAANRLDKSNLTVMTGNVIKITVILGMLLIFEPHVWYIGAAGLISTIYVVLRNIHYKKTLLPEVQVSRRFFDQRIMRELVGVGIWNSINQLTQVLLTGLDLIITNLFVSVASMNLLSYAKLIPTQLLSLISAIVGTFAPVMTLAYGKGDMREFVKETNFAIKLCGFLCSVPIVGLVIFGEDFFSLWLCALSEEEIHEVARLSALTILPQFVSVYIFPLYTVNTITAKLKIPVTVSILMGIANVVIVFILVNTTGLGVYAVAGVSSILSLGRIILFVPIYAASSLKLPFVTFYKPLFRGLVNSGAISAVFFAMRRFVTIRSWGSFIAMCAVAAVIGYAISLLSVFAKGEREQLKNMIRRKIVGGIQ